MSWSEDDLAAHYARLKTPQEGVAPAAPSNDSEALIEAECTKILEGDGWRALRTDPVSDRARGKGFGELGMADHLYIRYVYNHSWNTVEFKARVDLAWVEFKRAGEKAKKHQTEWHIKERARGALTLIAGEDFPASVEGFRKWYETSGLKRQVTE